MDAELWGQAWNLVSSTIITLFGYAFTVLGAATTTLIALTILAAIFRLILMPLLGTNTITGFFSQKAVSHETKQRAKIRKEKAEKKNSSK